MGKIVVRLLCLFYRVSKVKKVQAKDERNMAVILICIVTIFFVSNIPRVLLNCSEFLMMNEIIR